MACVNPDGSISATARAMLKLLAEAMTPEEAAEKSGQPLFKVRSSLREMNQAGLVETDGEKYRVSEKGRATAQK
ncbi:MAG TPA: hypothetical protein PLF13_00270 [candidate division Zixibacteria bacterium]|nr:hypothetical protein [candidate division Zixibacteria bacterium]